MRAVYVKAAVVNVGAVAMTGLIEGACALASVERSARRAVTQNRHLCRFAGHQWHPAPSHGIRVYSCSRCGEPGFWIPS